MDFMDLEGTRGGVWAALWTELLTRLTSFSSSLAGLNATSASSLSIGTGAKSFTLDQATVEFPEDVVVRARRASDPTAYMVGTVSAAAAGSVELAVTSTGGSGGPYTDWILTVDLTTVPSPMTPRAVTGAGTVVSTDLGQIIYCTSTATLAFDAVATLGSGFWCTIVCGSGVRTLDPNGSEQIDGRSRIKLLAGESAIVAVVDGALKVIAAKGYGQGLRMWPSVVTGAFDIEDGFIYRVDTTSAIAIGMLQDGAGDGAQFQIIDAKGTFPTYSCFVDAYSAGYDTIKGDGSYELDVMGATFTRTEATADWGVS